jgi:UDPglucose 6-dehydrogenase
MGINICVYGLWHLGTVTAACLADMGHQVIGLDQDPTIIQQLQTGIPPLFEPDLETLLQKGINAGNLTFTDNAQAAVEKSEILWVTFDTPVNEQDEADTNFVMEQVRSIFPLLRSGMLVIISSQLPVGSTTTLAQEYAEGYPQNQISFAYSPENLRLGNAIKVFMNPDRVIIGVKSNANVETITALFTPLTTQLVFMSVESAEMTKHALNAFLATSVTFMNELATLCELVGADAREVERGLKSEARIGPRAYLRPGGAFAGGTLARDLIFLQQIGKRHALPIPLFNAVTASNETHKFWAYHRLQALLGNLHGRKITLLGITYKPGTSTLRRSAALELAARFLADGALLSVYDPHADPMPPQFAVIKVHQSAQEALAGAEAVIISTEWPEFKQISAATYQEAMITPIILDANGFLVDSLGKVKTIQYYSVGKPT